MNNGEREGLIARIRQVRRVTAVRDRPPAGDDDADQQNDRLRALETRVAHLEQMVQGFQDSVHRESDRHSKLIAELQTQIEPGAMSAALADDARQRGL
jgi:predicted nuclease with TOPRIM domain